MSILPLGKLEPAASTPENNPCATSLIERKSLRVQLCVLQRLPCSRYGESSRTRNMRTFFDVEEMIWINLPNLTCDLHRKRGRIECRDAADTASRITKSIPKFIA